LVTLEDLLKEGPLAMTFHRGHWCPYCRINTKAFTELQERITSGTAQFAATIPERQEFAARVSAEGKGRFPVLTDVDNGYALSLNLALWVGDEMQKILKSGGRQLPDYQGNNAWVLPIPATFVIDKDGCSIHRSRSPEANGYGGLGVSSKRRALGLTLD
jgi:peroxiredoxin